MSNLYDKVGWVLLIAALAVYGARIWARGTPDRRFVGQIAAATIVVMLVGIVVFVIVSIYSGPAS
jgi:hypothetical protein